MRGPGAVAERDRPNGQDECAHGESVNESFGGKHGEVGLMQGETPTLLAARVDYGPLC